MFIKKSILTTIIFSLCVLPSFGQKGKGIRAAVRAMKNTPTHVTNPVNQALNNISRRSSAVRINGAPASLQNDVQRTVAVTQLNTAAAQININLTRQAVINMGKIGHSEDEALKEGMWTITGTAEEEERANEPVVNDLSRKRIITFIRTSMQEADPAQRLQLTDNLLEIENGNFKRMIFAGVGEYPEILEQFLPNYPKDTEEIVKEVLLYGFFNETTLPVLLRNMSEEKRTDIVIDMLRREKFNRATALLPYGINLKHISADIDYRLYKYRDPDATFEWFDRAEAKRAKAHKKKKNH